MSDLFKFGRNRETTPPVSGPLDGGLAKLTLNNDTFEELRTVIYNLSGIYFTESKKYLLEGRIAKRLVEKKLSSYEEYVKFISSPNARQEINALFEAVTINETYFFRAEQQFEAFESVIIPEIIQKQTTLPRTIRVWSAASSTGEEAYTLAIIFLERIKPKFPNIQFQILASDINNAVLESARKGIFKDYAIRNVPPGYLAKYFKKEGTSYLLSDEIKRMVKFMNINLYDSNAMKSVTGCHVIFCCNVLIYFDLESKQKVVTNLYNSLNRGGYLIIGYSESLHGVTKAFKLVHLPKAMAYKKD